MKQIFHSILNWTPKKLARWEKVRAKGAAQYILSRSFVWDLVSLAVNIFMDALHGNHYVVASNAHLFHAVGCFYPLGLVIATVSCFEIEKSYLLALQPEDQRETFDYAAQLRIYADQKVIYADQKRIIGWEKIKAKGLARYILTRASAYAVFFFGLQIVNDVMQGNGLGIENFLAFARRLAGCCAFGVVMACFNWYVGEDAYRTARERESKRAEVEGISNAVKA